MCFVDMGSYLPLSILDGRPMDDLLCMVSSDLLQQHEDGTENTLGCSNNGICVHHIQSVCIQHRN